jgi:hypothetical protein
MTGVGATVVVVAGTVDVEVDDEVEVDEDEDCGVVATGCVGLGGSTAT